MTDFDRFLDRHERTLTAAGVVVSIFGLGYLALHLWLVP